MTLVRIYILLLSLLPVSGMAQGGGVPSSPKSISSPVPTPSHFAILPPVAAPTPVPRFAAIMKKSKAPKKLKAQVAPIAPVAPAPPTVIVVQVPAQQPVAAPVAATQIAKASPTPAPKEDIYQKDLALLQQKAPSPMPRVIYRTSRSTRTQVNLGKNGLTAEGGGRGGYYSVNYDRMTGSHVALGFGFSYINLRADDLKNTPLQFVMAPIYGNFYFLGDEHRPFFTLGATIVSVSGEIDKDGEVEKILFEKFGDGFNGIAAVPSAGLGYEFRGGSGFMTRLTVYGAYINRQVIPWGGISIGTAF